MDFWNTVGGQAVAETVAVSLKSIAKSLESISKELAEANELKKQEIQYMDDANELKAESNKYL